MTSEGIASLAINRHYQNLLPPMPRRLTIYSQCIGPGKDSLHLLTALVELGNVAIAAAKGGVLSAVTSAVVKENARTELVEEEWTPRVL